MNYKYEFGLDTFGDIAIDEQTGYPMTHAASLRGIIEEGILADKLGIDILALGEHHRDDYAISSPEIVLAALATVTKQIKLGTGVTVLSSDDPVRVYERFATLDALSNGRAQVMLGRGSFTESFPLFGYQLKDYEELFEEKIALFNELITKDVVNWRGRFTQELEEVTVYPKMEDGRQLATYVGVGGSPESILRAIHYRYPVMLAIISGDPARFRPFVDLYERASIQANQPLLPMGIHSHGVIAETDEKAYEIAWHYLKKSMDRIGRDRGWSEMTKEKFDYEVTNGSYYVGNPETVAKKMAQTIKTLNVHRFDLVYGTGGQLQSDRMETIRLYGEQVIPRVKELLKES